MNAQTFPKRRALWLIGLVALALALPTAAQDGTPSLTPTASRTPTVVTVTNTPTPEPTAPIAAPPETSERENQNRAVITLAVTQTPTTPPIPILPLESGTIDGSITESSPRARYSFTGRRDEGITITMETTSGNLDPVLSLIGPDGRQIATNDDRAVGDRNAQITLSLPTNGLYVIEAARFNQGEMLSSGTFQLTLTRSTAPPPGTPNDPQQPPDFGVPVETLAYGAVTNGEINADLPLYFAFFGSQGDLVRLILTRTGGDLLPLARIYDDQRREIGRDAQTRDTEAIVYATLPQTGWYLIEAGRRESTGAGTFDLFINKLANAVLRVGESVSGEFTPDSPALSYIVNARLGDQISATMFTVEQGSTVQPQIELLDLSLRGLDRATGERFVTVSGVIPRSAPYIIRVTNRNPNASGAFNLRLSSVPATLTALNAEVLPYNDQTEDVINDVAPVDLYRFSGKTGELVTITMTALTPSSQLDPYLILMDGDLNELAANDDTAATRDARIVQYRLPKDSEYLVLASRSNLGSGTTSGSYRLSLTVGEIRLEEGALSASLVWGTSADLNLFVRDPNGTSINWSRPTSTSGGALQIDSNTGCTTPSDQPIEHIYWANEPPTGDYGIWAWYQAGCGATTSTPFRLTVMLNGEPLLVIQDELLPGQRYEAAIRVGSAGQGFIVDTGMITQPLPQQTVSEGGDPLISISAPVEAEITNEVYARFYQFSGTLGNRVRITVVTVTGDLDPTLALLSSSDIMLPDGSNDDAGDGSRNAALEYTLPYTGQYIINVSRYAARGGLTTGRFRLLIELVTAGEGY